MQAPGMQFVYITLCKIRGLHRINSISNRVSSENNGLHQKTNSGDGNGDPLQHSCLENSMNREAWEVKVDRVAKSQTHAQVFFLVFLSVVHAYKGHSVIISSPVEGKKEKPYFPCHVCFYAPRSTVLLSPRWLGQSRRGGEGECCQSPQLAHELAVLCCAWSLSCVQLFMTLWTVAC